MNLIFLSSPLLSSLSLKPNTMSEWLTGGLSKLSNAASAAEGMLNSFDKVTLLPLGPIKRRGKKKEQRSPIAVLSPPLPPLPAINLVWWLTCSLGTTHVT